MITVNIAVESYLKEYITGKYFDPESGVVRFPSSLDIYHLIYDLLQKRPAGRPVDVGNLKFALPKRRLGKDPVVYNYLSERAQKLLAKKMKLMMWAELHEMMDENKHLHGMQFKESVFIFMNRYAIESISEDAFLKNYQRWRDKLRRKTKRAYKRKTVL